MGLEDIAALIIRVTIGALFVISAYTCSKDAGARQGAMADTALLFPSRPELFTLAGVLVMLLGGLSVLLGIFPRLGALALTLFLIPAAMIHFRKAGQAVALKDAILAGPAGKSSGTRQSVAALGNSAVLGNFTSALKNLAPYGADALCRAGRRRADADRLRTRWAVARSPHPALNPQPQRAYRVRNCLGHRRSRCAGPRQLPKYREIILHHPLGREVLDPFACLRRECAHLGRMSEGVAQSRPQGLGVARGEHQTMHAVGYHLRNAARV